MEPVRLAVRDEVSLTDQETKIFATLMEVCAKHETGTTLRVAGGWVRDKLLGRESSDIDIAIDNMTGRQFAEILNGELYPGQTKFGVTEKNAEASKHLEVACMKVHGVMLDLVNLRAEDYSEDSRVPDIDIGTPLQDALRRDLTINALFYNINERKVEDWTEKGLADLREGLVRTPLDPLQTFLDDPL